MKKLVYVAALAMMATTGAFAQKANVKAAEKLTDASNFGEARRLAKETLTHEETKADVYAWYVAGLVEHEDFRKTLAASMLPQNKIDEAAMYTKLSASVPFFFKAYELDQMPNEKGKVKPKYTKKIAAHLKEDYQYLLNGGNVFMSKNNYPAAAKSFAQYLDIKSHPMFANDKEMTAMDTTAMQVAYFACLLSFESKQYDQALELARKYNDIVGDKEKDALYQVLCGSLLAKGDTVAAVNALVEGAKRFPATPYYISNAIAVKMTQGNEAEAAQLLEKAIENDPKNPLYLSMMGDMYGQKEQWDKSIEWYEKSLEVNPEGFATNYNLGLSYYNLANTILNAERVGKLEEDKANALFKKAVPRFEVAYKEKPEEVYYIFANVCKRLGLDSRYQELKKAHNIQD